MVFGCRLNLEVSKNCSFQEILQSFQKEHSVNDSAMSDQENCSQCKRRLNIRQGIWCFVCGYVHVKCSGLSSSALHYDGFVCEDRNHVHPIGSTTNEAAHLRDHIQTVDPDGSTTTDEGTATQSSQSTVLSRLMRNMSLNDRDSVLAENATEQPSGNHNEAPELSPFREAFLEVANWRTNLFFVPRGRVGKDFITEMASQLQGFAEDRPHGEDSLNAAMLMPTLLLQQTNRNSNNKTDAANLLRRLELWKEGKLHELVAEGSSIQRNLPMPNKKKPQSRNKQFSNAMKQGKLGSAISCLSNEMGKGVLGLKDTTDGKTVKELLLEKHPKARNGDPDSIVSQTEIEPPDFHPVLFDNITGALVRQRALQLGGSGGPSGADSTHWKRILTEHGRPSDDLCNAIALVARKLCLTTVDPIHTANLRDCRLIALDKNPGIRPIGICDVLRRLIGKVCLSVLKPLIREISGHQQLAAGYKAGCEAAIHSIREIFAEDDCEGLLLIDASNAFNELNRTTALRNIEEICPPFATLCGNFYRKPSHLNIDNSFILSEEGTTQ